MTWVQRNRTHIQAENPNSSVIQLLIHHFVEVFDLVLHYPFSDTYQVLLSYSDTLLHISFVIFFIFIHVLLLKQNSS